jgi:prepilin-type N-terminal cleavage/methylation domain-containing protein
MQRSPVPPRGFTLVEIMVVVVIIGLLAAIAIPAFQEARRSTVATRVATDLKVFSEAFALYALEHGVYPPDVTPGVIPPLMVGHLPSSFTRATPAGGFYDWDYQQFGVTAGVSVFSPTAGIDVMQRVDRILDDGNLTSGRFRERSSGYILVIED